MKNSDFYLDWVFVAICIIAVFYFGGNLLDAVFDGKIKSINTLSVYFFYDKEPFGFFLNFFIHLALLCGAIFYLFAAMLSYENHGDHQCDKKSNKKIKRRKKK